MRNLDCDQSDEGITVIPCSNEWACTKLIKYIVIFVPQELVIFWNYKIVKHFQNLTIM